MVKFKTSPLKRMARSLLDEHEDDDLCFVAMILYNASLSGPDFGTCLRIVRSVL